MVLLGIAMFAAISAIAMLLWNFLIPEIFGLITINFWQAAGLLVLARILFGGFGFNKGRMMMADRMHTMNPIHQKWMKMTPEQREEFINKRRKFRFGGPFGKDFFDMKEHEEGRNENE